jgi:hypothetical protein
MAGVTFIHPNVDVGVLNLRLPPTSVEWSFKLNTSITDTFGGQVVQILSTSYDNLVVEGRFGKEGPHGANINKEGAWDERDPVGFYDLGSRSKPRRGGTGHKAYEIGLSQMMMYFRRYFSVATAGGDHLQPGGSFVRGAYNQQYMKLAYEGNIEDYERAWLVYPTSFPSFRRSNEDFAPQWRVEFQVVEPDFFIDTKSKLAAIARLRANVGYRPLNPFSDPLAQEIDPKTKKGQKRIVKITQAQLDELNTSVLDYYGSMLPTLTPADLTELIASDASVANVYNKKIDKLVAQTQASKKKKKDKKNNVGPRGPLPGTGPR